MSYSRAACKAEFLALRAALTYFGVKLVKQFSREELLLNVHAALRAAPPRMKARWLRACGTPPSADGIRALRFACGATRTHTVLSANVRASGQASLSGCADACRAFIVNCHFVLRRIFYY